MHPQKKQYANQVYFLVTEICTEFTDDKRLAIKKVLHISKRDAIIIIKKIIIALPDAFFYSANQSMKNDMIEFISKNLVFFQAQENFEGENYAYHLIGFINQLTQSIANRYYPQ